MIRVGILTISDKCARGEREDASGDLLASLAAEIPADVFVRRVVPDEKAEIVGALREIAQEVDVIFTTGGTGIAERDVTPEATIEVIERELPGFGELMRVKGYESTPRSILSRATAGVSGRTLIVNMPGSPAAVGECFEVIAPSLAHAVEVLEGAAEECARDDGSRREGG
jgi:molybdenum cofactor synthesis domain-containing protein